MPSDDEELRIVVERLASHLGASFENVKAAYLEKQKIVQIALRRHECAVVIPAANRPVCEFIDHTEFMNALSIVSLDTALSTLARLYGEAHVALYRASRQKLNKDKRFGTLGLDRKISLRKLGQTLQRRPEAVNDQIMIKPVGYGDASCQAVFRGIATMSFEKLPELESLYGLLPAEFDLLPAERKRCEHAYDRGVGVDNSSDILSANAPEALCDSYITQLSNFSRWLLSTNPWAPRTTEGLDQKNFFRKEEEEKGDGVYGSEAVRRWVLATAYESFAKDCGFHREIYDMQVNQNVVNVDNGRSTPGNVEQKSDTIISKYLDRERSTLISSKYFIPHQGSKHRSAIITADMIRNKMQAAASLGTRASTRRFLPVHVNGTIEMTIPDSGSFANIMSEQYAKAHQIPINRDRRNQEQFHNAAGGSFISVGQARVSVAFADEPQKSMTEVFSVVQGCVADLIMGNRFLQTHSILSLCKNRLVKFTSSARKHWRLLQMYLPRQRFLCRIAGSFSEVTLDTGSDKNFISAAYARQNDWRIAQLGHEQFVKLANGHEIRVLGYVDKAIGIADHSQEARFYVLPDLMCDVILGDELIDEVDIFSKIEDTTWSRFLTENHEYQAESPSDCFAIEWLDRIERQVREYYADPAYKIPADVFEYLNNDGGPTSPSNVSTSFYASMRRKWGRSRSSRLMDRRAQYDALQSGLWLRLKKIDMAELHAKQSAEIAMSLAAGDDLFVLTNENVARRQKHKDERDRIIALRQDLLDWRKANPSL